MGSCAIAASEGGGTVTGVPHQMTPAARAIARKRDRSATALAPLAPLGDGARIERRVVEVTNLAAPLSSAKADTLLGSSSIDASGRIGDAKAFRALGWAAASALGFVVLPGGVVHVRPAQTGDLATAVVSKSTRLPLPLAVRDALGVEPGDLVVLVADAATHSALVAGPRGASAAFAALTTSTGNQGEPDVAA
jgi:hypothetical protein